MPQTLGPKIPFYAPLRPSKKASEDGDASALDQLWARILCKDAIGKYLGLIPAPYRYSRFDSANADTPSGNNGRRFMINDKIGAKPFKLGLRPPSSIPVDGQSQGAEPEPGPALVNAKSLSIYVPQHITVFDMIWWINNDTGTYVQLDGTQTQMLAGYVPGGGVTNIRSVTTPAERKYNVRTDLFPESREISTVRFVPNVPEP